MLRFKQFIQLLEELNPAQKQSVSSWLGSSTTIPDDQIKASQNAINLSKHIIPEDTDHIILPAYSPIINAINDHLKHHGYEIHDYASGTARRIGDTGKTVSMPLDQLRSRIKKDRIKDSNLQYDAGQHAHNEAKKIFNPNELEQYNTVYNKEHGDASPHEIAMSQFDDKKRQHYNTVFNLAKQNYLKPHLDRDVTDDELKNTGFDIKDGIASRIVPTKTESIGKILEKTDADHSLINDFANDNRELGQNIHQYNIIISRNPYHIAECSTNKPWTSCAGMDDEGTYTKAAARKLPNEIHEGTHVVYLVHKDHQHLPVQQQIDNAVSRVLLKPYVSAEGHRILHPENSSYSAKQFQTGEGDAKKNVSMINMLKKFTETHFPLLHDDYTKLDTIYDDDKLSKLYSQERKQFLEKELLDKINGGKWTTDHIDDAIRDNLFSNKHHKALQSAYLTRLQSDYKMSTNEISHAMKLGYHKDKLHLQDLKDNLNRQFSSHGMDMNKIEDKLNHSINNNYFDKNYLHALKTPLLHNIKDWDFRYIDLAKRRGFWDDKIHKEALHNAFNESMEHFLQHPMGYYLSGILKNSTENDFFDPKWSQKVHESILDHIKSNNYVDKEIMNNLFHAGLLSKEHLEHMNDDDDREYYQDKFNKAEEFLRKIESNSPHVKAEKLKEDGYYNAALHKNPLRDKLTESLNMAIAKNFHPLDMPLMRDALKSGYFDWNTHKKLAQTAILNAMKRSNYNITFDTTNNLWDDDIHKIPFQKQFLEDIKSGKYNTNNFDEANKLSLLTKEHIDAMPTGLLKKIESGKYEFNDIDHANKYRYFNITHENALPNGLSKNLDSSWYYDGMGLPKQLIEHAVKNGYLNDEHRTKLTKIFHTLLKNGQLNQDAIDHARLHNYFPTDKSFLADYHRR